MRRTAPTATLIALLAAAGAAAAQNAPWHVGVSQGFGYDSNVYRVGDGVALPAWASKSDSFATTALVGGLDLRAGRQHVRGSASLRSSRYQDNDSLDHEGYALRLGLDWETVGRLSGELELQADRRLASFVNDTEIAATLERNVETVQQQVAATSRPNRRTPSAISSPFRCRTTGTSASLPQSERATSAICSPSCRSSSTKTGT